MSKKWPGKYVIGLTGNIGTGKSVVRKMLEHLGAYTIDADALGHRAITKDAPGYQPVLDTFGRWLVDAEGQIDRAKLGKVVFNDPQALRSLESMVHPLVAQAVDAMVQRASQYVIAIEAIKLLESGLGAACDSIWVTDTPEAVQIQRLSEKRRMSREDALARARLQSSQAEKRAAANVVIDNSGAFEDTWKQVAAAWKSIVPAAGTGALALAETGTLVPAETGGPPRKEDGSGFVVQRGRPRDSESIAALITRLSGGARPLSKGEVMAAFGEKAFMMLRYNGRPVGVAGWQVENLVARTTDFFLDSTVPLEEGLQTLITEVERASAELQCEASLLFLPPELATHEGTWKQLGYEKRSVQKLGVQAWTDAANESQQAYTVLFFKQLRTDRVLRPI